MVLAVVVCLGAGWVCFFSEDVVVVVAVVVGAARKLSPGMGLCNNFYTAPAAGRPENIVALSKLAFRALLYGRLIY